MMERTRPQTERRLSSRSERRRLAAPLVIITIGAVTTAFALGTPLVAVVAGLVVLALLIADRPSIATLVAVGLIFSNAVVVATKEFGVPTPFAGLVPLLFLVTVGHRVCIQRKPLVLPLATPWIIALFLVQAIGAALSREPATAMGGVGTFLLEGLLLWLLLANAARTAEILRQAAIVIVALGALLSLLSLAQKVTDTESNEQFGFAQVANSSVGKDKVTGASGKKRHAGPVGEQNRWAQVLCMAGALGVALATTDRSKTIRLASAAGTVAIGAGIVLTYSRGATVGLTLAAVVAMLLRWVPRATTAAAGVVVVLLLGVVAPTFTDRASTVVSSESSPLGDSGTKADGSSSKDGSFDNRATEASAALAIFFRHPVVGVGPNLFPTYFQDEARRLGAERIVGVERESHNLYLGLAAEAGALGLLAFGAVMVAILGPLAAARKRLLARRPDLAGLATGYAMALVLYLTTGLFLHFAYIRYFWLFAGLAAAMGMVAEADEEDAEATAAPAPA